MILDLAWVLHCILIKMNETMIKDSFFYVADMSSLIGLSHEEYYDREMAEEMCRVRNDLTGTSNYAVVQSIPFSAIPGRK